MTSRRVQSTSQHGPLACGPWAEVVSTEVEAVDCSREGLDARTASASLITSTQQLLQQQSSRPRQQHGSMGRLALPSSGAILPPGVCSLAFTTHLSAPSLSPRQQPRLSHSRRLDALSDSYCTHSTSLISRTHSRYLPSSSVMGTSPPLQHPSRREVIARQHRRPRKAAPPPEPVDDPAIVRTKQIFNVYMALVTDDITTYAPNDGVYTLAARLAAATPAATLNKVSGVPPLSPPPSPPTYSTPTVSDHGIYSASTLSYG